MSELRDIRTFLDWIDRVRIGFVAPFWFGIAVYAVVVGNALARLIFGSFLAVTLFLAGRSVYRKLRLRKREPASP